MRILPLSILILFLPFFPFLSFAQDPHLDKIETELRQVPVNDDAMLDEVPLAAHSLLPEWKRGIRQTIVTVLSNPRSSSRSPAQFEEEIRWALGDKGVVLAGEARPYYAQLVDLKVNSPEGFPAVMVVRTSINLECGRDTSLYVFERKQSSWELVLDSSANDCTAIDGARENLNYELSTLHDTPSWYVLLAYSPPWCTSCWSTLYYEALRPSANPEQPSTVYAGRGEFYRCADEPFHLDARPSEFTVSHADMMYADMDLFSKTAVERFSLQEGYVHRIPPARQNAPDFVDQWINLPEKEAVALLAPGSSKELLGWHQKLSGWLKESKDRAYLSNYEWEQACSDDGFRWQVKLSFDVDGQPVEPGFPLAVYFVVDVTAKGIVLHAVGTQEDSTCKGVQVHPSPANI